MDEGDALIGDTGFVGSTLLRGREFGACFNSRTIEGIGGRRFRTVVCAGAPGAKWLANREPEADLVAIGRLQGWLERVEAERFVLISTVDVYRAPVGVTERDEPEMEGLHAYGRHRLGLERFVAGLARAGRFGRCSVVRLPGLFGRGLRKNLLFDLVHGHEVKRIAAGGVLQWYPMARLVADLEVIEAAGPGVVNVAVEPVATAVIRDRWFPEAVLAEGEAGPRYDVRTAMPGLLGGRGDYHVEAGESLAAMEAFVRAERGA